MDIKALSLNSRFSLPPNSLGYCGKDSAPEKFKACVTASKCEGVVDECRHFIVLYPYLKTLAKISKKPKFSYEVIESYWLGNELLTMAKIEDYQILLTNFKRQGVPKWLVEELAAKKPKKFIPSHLFQVLHVGVGRASGSVPYNIETINNCMIRWGNVLSIEDTSVTVSLNSLNLVSGAHQLTQITETFPVVPGFIPDLKVGDVVTAHWKQVTKKLTEDEIKKITFWTNEVLKAVN